MCFPKKQKPVEIAAAPAPPLPGADTPEIGQTRREETREEFGQDAPNYRVSRTAKAPKVNPSAPIQM